MKIKKSDYLTMEIIAERLNCEPDALAIIEAIERLKKRANKRANKLSKKRLDPSASQADRERALGKL